MRAADADNAPSLAGYRQWQLLSLSLSDPSVYSSPEQTLHTLLTEQRSRSFVIVAAKGRPGQTKDYPADAHTPTRIYKHAFPRPPIPYLPLCARLHIFYDF